MFELLAVIGVVGLWVLNFFISFVNAVSVGKAWTESEIVGGWQKIVTWSAAIMSAAGFTWCYLIIAMLIASYFNVLEPRYVDLMGNLGYLIIIFPVLGAGLAITIDSWAYTIKNRSFSGLAVSSYNTFAQTYNMFRALDTIPRAVEGVFDSLLSGGDDDNGKGIGGLIAVIIVILVTVAGALTTIAIVKWIAKKDRNKSIQKIKKAYPTS